MSVGPILTLGLGSFAGRQFLPTLGYGTGAKPPVPPRTRGSVGDQRMAAIRRDDEELMMLAATMVGATHVE